MTKLLPVAHFTGTALDMASMLRREFEAMVDGDEYLSPEARQEVKRHFYFVNGFMDKHRMSDPQRSFKQLIDLRKQAHPIPRRDGTSRFNHELAQMIYVIWIYENRERLSKSKLSAIHNKARRRFLFNTLDRVSTALTVIPNHDSREDYGLLKEAYGSFMIEGIPDDKSRIKKVKKAVMAFDRVNKLDEDSDTKYARRFGETELSLGCKMIDTLHNFMSMIGSHRTIEKTRKYVATKMEGYALNQDKIGRNNTLVYLDDYLKAQAELILLYCDVREGIKPVVDLEMVVDRHVAQYQTSSINSRIHPILGIMHRIFEDRNIVYMFTDTPPAPASTPAVAPSPPQAIDPLRLKHA